jgi:signal transduction histidine kinase/DNA-binding response OmpR family regulator
MRDFIADSLLRPEGFAVDVARDGAEGLEAALANTPDLIVTDLAMPGMSGLEMVRRLREHHHRMPVILITAEGSEDLAVQALRLGVMDYFVKPFDGEEMLSAVKRTLQATRIGRVRAGVPDQRRLQALNTLIAIGKSINSLLDLEMVLSRVVEAAVYLSRTEEGILMLLDPDTGELYVRAAKNLEDGLQSMRLPVRDSLAGHVIRTGKPMLVAGEGMQQIKTRYLVRSLLYVPLKIKDSVIGVLGVHNRFTDRDISREDVGIVTALSDYAAIAIVNARLFETSENERARLARIFDQVEDAILAVDDEDQVVLCNPAARQFLDQDASEQDSIGRPLVEVTSNRSLLELMEGARQDEMMQGEVQLYDDRTFNAHVIKVEGIGSVVVMQDITHLKERDRIKSELLEMVSHQVRSPLTAILSYIELLIRTGNLSPQQMEFAEQVKHNVKLITETIGDLLDLGKIEAGLDRQREPVSLGHAVYYTVDALQNRIDAKDQHLEVITGDDLPTVLGNPVRLRQVFINLVDNAIKYTPEGGEIEVSIHEEGEHAVVRISDDGIGIPLDDQPHIFDKFYRASGVSSEYEGTGLGLSIVKSIVEMHGGRIWVESRPGEGTTFTVMLPAFAKQASDQDEHPTLALDRSPES